MMFIMSFHSRPALMSRCLFERPSSDQSGGSSQCRPMGDELGQAVVTRLSRPVTACSLVTSGPAQAATTTHFAAVLLDTC